MIKKIVYYILGRHAFDPVYIAGKDSFVRYLEQSGGRRVASRIFMSVPILSLKLGYIFFENDQSIWITYNGRPLSGLGGAGYFQGRWGFNGASDVLFGVFRQPCYVEGFRILLAIFWLNVVTTSLRIAIEEPVPIGIAIAKLLINILLVTLFIWFIKFMMSILDRYAIKRLKELLQGYSYNSDSCPNF